MFTSLPEHYAQWKTTAPVPERMRRPASAWAELSSQQRLLAGILHPTDCSTLVRHFALFMQPEDRGRAHAPKVLVGSPPARSS